MQSLASLVVFLVATGLTTLVPVTVAEAERRRTVVSPGEPDAGARTKPTSEKAAELKPVITLNEGRLGSSADFSEGGGVLKGDTRAAADFLDAE
jgi:hypothetical protein